MFEHIAVGILWVNLSVSVHINNLGLIGTIQYHIIQFLETQTPDDIPTSQKSEQASKKQEIDENQELPGDLFPEQNNKERYDKDPTWTPKEIDRAYETLKEDDDSIQTNANHRYVKKSCDFSVKKCNNSVAFFYVL